ncbi:hypothetical protein [Halorubrum sp. DM2]|uniref:DUF7344 domain-containing protein n=1 Tax=Halorubrum sp. DM2 TaxID=2527867 RepID=UPI0024B76101|nr:hypothetical protein [Halorubrum sp. DM2]
MIVLNSYSINELLTSNDSVLSGNDRTDTVVTMVSRDPEQSVQFNTVLDILRIPRRRYIVYILQEADESVVPFETIVEEVRKYEASDEAESELPQRQSIRMALIHVHLPKLESIGLLKRDPQTGDVRFYGDPLLEEWAERTSQFELE